MQILLIFHATNNGDRPSLFSSGEQTANANMWLGLVLFFNQTKKERCAWRIIKMRSQSTEQLIQVSWI